MSFSYEPGTTAPFESTSCTAAVSPLDPTKRNPGAEAGTNAPAEGASFGTPQAGEHASAGSEDKKRRPRTAKGTAVRFMTPARATDDPRQGLTKRRRAAPPFRGSRAWHNWSRHVDQ